MMIRDLNIKKSKKGITLIELIITISLISVVLLVAYDMQIFGYKIFNKGSSKADIQSNLRLNADFISDKIRYASNLKILKNIDPSSFDPSKEYIYAEGGTLKYYNTGTIENIPGSSSGVTTSLYFEDKDAQTVYFKLNGAVKTEAYTIDSSVYMLNVGIGGIGEGDGTLIEFEQGIPVNVNKNAKPVETVTINAVPSGTTLVNRTSTLQFTYFVTPSDASINTVSWAIDSASSSFATISSIGTLKVTNAPLDRVIQVKATALDGSGITSNIYLVTVKDVATVDSTSVSVTSNLKDNTSPDYIFQTGGTLQMTGMVLPLNVTDKVVNWSTDKTDSIATIDGVGLLLTNAVNKSLGNIKVTATLNSNSSVFGSKYITIIPNIGNILLTETNKSVTSGKNWKYKNYSGDISCFVNTDGNDAKLSTGVKSIDWRVDSGAILTKINDNKYRVTKDNAGTGSKININVVVRPISGQGITKNIVVTVN
jgi:prepilin-type N-terminal cleavage/methylation domain-containing protein